MGRGWSPKWELREVVGGEAVRFLGVGGNGELHEWEVWGVDRPAGQLRESATETRMGACVLIVLMAPPTIGQGEWPWLTWHTAMPYS
jgi:hypothetical protein